MNDRATSVSLGLITSTVSPVTRLPRPFPRRWEGRCVSLREVVLTLARYSDSDEAVWQRLGEVVRPPLGAVLGVAGQRNACLSFAARNETISWTEVGGKLLTWGYKAEVTGGHALLARGVDFLVARGEEPSACQAVGSHRLLGDINGIVPAVDQVVDELRALYLSSQLEAWGGRWPAGYQPHAPRDNPRWWSAERRARRRLIGLQLNERLLGM
jgi:hypothetical protein